MATETSTITNPPPNHHQTAEELADPRALSLLMIELSELEVVVEWCVFQGCTVYFVPKGSDPINDIVRPIAELRACFMDKEHGDQHAQDLIRNANDAVLLQVTMEASSVIPSKYQLRDNFYWVAYHEGRMPGWRIANANHNFDLIRSEYHDKQAHNPNAKNLLAAD